MYEQEEDVNESLESSAQEQEIQQPSAESDGEVVQEAASAPQEEKQQPFHEHPRFKELVEQKNQFKQQVEQSQRQMQELQQRIESLMKAQQASQPKPQDELMERLKSIDPVFAEKFGKINEVDTVKQEIEELRQWRQEQAAQATRMEAKNTMEKLFSENNVSKEMRNIYEERIIAAASRNPELGVKDLPNVFKSIHEEMNKLFEAAKRETTKNYVADKKAAAAKPMAQPKGKAAPVGQKSQYSKNPEEARAQLVQDILRLSKADKDI